MVTVDPDFTDVSYLPAGVTGHYNHVTNVFIGKGTAPAKGRPCLIFCNNSGFIGTSKYDQLTEANGVSYAMWRRGWVVMPANTTVSNQKVTANGATIDGLGLWKSPLSQKFQTTHFLEKDGPMLVGYARASKDVYGIDPDNIYIMGRSGGSAGALASGLLPDFASLAETWGMHPVSSRPNGIIGRANVMAWVPSTAQPASTLSLALAKHFATGDSQSAGSYSVQAADLGATAATQATVTQQGQASQLNFGFNRAMAWYGDSLNTQQEAIDVINAKQRFYLYSPGDSDVIDTVNFDDGVEWNFSINPAANPYTGLYVSNVVTQVHSPVNMYMLREALREIGVRWGVGGGRSRCVTTPHTDNYVASNHPIGYTGVEKALNPSGGTFDDPVESDMADWLEECVAHPQ